MEKCTAYILTKDEAQGLLRNAMADSNLELRKGAGGLFYTAASGINFLSGAAVDIKLAQALKIEKCVHFALEDDRIIVAPLTSD